MVVGYMVDMVDMVGNMVDMVVGNMVGNSLPPLRDRPAING